MEDIQNPTKNNDQPDPNALPSVQVGSKESPRQAPGTSEFLKPSEAVSKIDGELAEIGVQAHSEQQELTQEQRAAGIEPSPSETPAQTEPTGIVKIMSDEKAQEEIKQIRNQISVDLSNDSVNFAPSKAFLAVLSVKVRKVMNLLRGRKMQTI